MRPKYEEKVTRAVGSWAHGPFVCTCGPLPQPWPHRAAAGRQSPPSREPLEATWAEAGVEALAQDRVCLPTWPSPSSTSLGSTQEGRLQTGIPGHDKSPCAIVGAQNIPY